MAEADKSDVAKKEEETLKFWKENRIFEKTLEKEAPNGEFVFYDGPPFATGLPHYGHILGSTSKDLFGRYKTMRGYYVRRRWGWDTHGLPIESLVEKKLGLKNRKEIVALGVEQFNETARGLVLEYVSEWKRYVDRLARWVDFDNSYKTMDASFTESVWWALKKIHEQGNLYEGRKVLMYCTRDETVLAKAEIAMDNTYKDVTEEAVTVKFKVKTKKSFFLEGDSLLAWTTTPWTLPGNVALAVSGKEEYSIYESRKTKERIVVAKKLAERVLGDAFGDYKHYTTLSGGELVGLEYEPLYEVEKVKAHESTKKWMVLPADFVTTEEGTGIVHTAVIYGEDDYQLGMKEGLPMVPLLNPNGTYNNDAPEFLRAQYIKKAEPLIKQDLEERGLLFSKAMHTHSYPHCYRCGTPLIYNAVSSWFINIQSVKNKLLSENEHVTWVPEHLKHGRFGKIVESAPDWTISRNRFWASPLPIWKDAQGNVTVIGSLDELKKLTKKSGNRYFVMRHGQSEKNVLNITDNTLSKPYHLTEQGRAEAKASAEKLKGEGIDLIITSPFLRTRETAEVVAETLGISADAIVVMDELQELNHGVTEGGRPSDYSEAYRSTFERFLTAPEGGETFAEMKRRMGAALYAIEEKYQGKNILLVSHGDPVAALLVAARGATMEQSFRLYKEVYPQKGEVVAFDFVPLPHNREYELDFHLPYIDRVELVNEKGEKLTRIPEVVDCWVESGSMPFAEYHYPFENKKEFEKRSPGDFVSEYIGQTRAWFYYMHAIGIHLFGRAPFRNVVTTGTILAANGEKLSKSKQNFTDPYVIFDRFGADALRYYLMSSVAMQAEDLQFRDEEVKEAHSRVLNILRNTKAFYELYKDEAPLPSAASDHILDRWIVLRLAELTHTMTAALDRYDAIRGTRPIRDFVEDFSTWYVRRSRDRVKGEDAEDSKRALATMRHVLLTLSKLMAPVTPYIAEEIYGSVKTENDPESVHLCEWPEGKKNGIANLFGLLGGGATDNGLLEDMTEVRRVVSLGLEKRSAANIKVRQPLSEVRIKSSRLKGKSELLDLIRDELNVKGVAVDPTISEDVILDTVITPELQTEGVVREALRFVQGLRKTALLSPKDKAVLVITGDDTRAFVEANWNVLQRTANLERFETGDAPNALALEGGKTFFFDVRRS